MKDNSEDARMKADIMKNETYRAIVSEWTKVISSCAICGRGLKKNPCQDCRGALDKMFEKIKSPEHEVGENELKEGSPDA